MKKILSTLLAAAMLVGTFTLGAMSVSAKELTANDAIGDQTEKDDGHGGFIDSNLHFSESLNVDKLEDITIEVNGKPAYWGVGYTGYKHAKLGSSDGKVEKNWLQIGIVGAEIKKSEVEKKAEKEGEKDVLKKDNFIKLTMGKSGDTYTQTFASTFASKGVTYSKVTADKVAKTVEAVIIYNDDPGYKVNDQLTGKCHDDHNNTATFKVTAVDGKKVTLKAENYVPAQSLLELVDKDGVYTTVNINYVSKVTVSDPQALTAEDTKAVTEKGTKQTLSNVAAKTSDGKDFGNAALLIDGSTGNKNKLEGSWPGAVTITFEAAEAVKAAYLVLYTQDDDTGKDRAPEHFILSGSTDGKDYKVIKEVLVSGIQNQKETPFAFALNNAGEYKYYKLEVLSKLGGTGYFQIGELELYTGDVTLTGKVPAEVTRVESQGTENSYNGTAPATPPTQGEDKPPVTPPTGDIALVLSVIALIAVAGAVVIAKKRKIEE